MAQGLFQASMADLPSEGAPPMPSAQGAPEQMPPAGGMAQDDQADDPAYEQAIERVTLAAIRVLKQPDVMQEVSAALSAPDPAQAVGNMAFDLTNQLDEKSGATLPEDVLPGAALSVLAIIGEMAELEEPVLVQATQSMLVRLMQESGQDADQIGQVMSQIDIGAMVKKAAPALMGQEGQEGGEDEDEGPGMSEGNEAEDD